MNICTACFDNITFVVCCDMHGRFICDLCWDGLHRAFAFSRTGVCVIDWKQLDTHVSGTIVEGLRTLIEELA